MRKIIVGCSFIECKYKSENEKLKRKYIIFNLIVIEDSLAQFNLTTHKFDKNGKMNYNFYPSPDIQISNIRRINNCLTILPNGNYYIQFHYNNVTPNEILFWIPYEGNIDIKFLGVSDSSRINNNNININNLENNPGIIFEKQIYKINEKLGDFYRRKAKIINFIENELHCNVNFDEEDRVLQYHMKKIIMLLFLLLQIKKMYQI